MCQRAEIAHIPANGYEFTKIVKHRNATERKRENKRMTHVDFYVLEKQTAKGIYPFACQLLEKMFKDNETVFVIFNTEQECESFNRLLWTYQDISFIPHCLTTDAMAAQTPIQLGLLNQLTTQTIVLNLSHDIVSSSSNLQRIAEIVPDEPLWRQASRKKFLEYKNQQCELTTHKIL